MSQSNRSNPPSGSEEEEDDSYDELRNRQLRCEVEVIPLAGQRFTISLVGITAGPYDRCEMILESLESRLHWGRQFMDVRSISPDVLLQSRMLVLSLLTTLDQTDLRLIARQRGTANQRSAVVGNWVDHKDKGSWICHCPCGRTVSRSPGRRRCKCRRVVIVKPQFPTVPRKPRKKQSYLEKEGGKRGLDVIRDRRCLLTAAANFLEKLTCSNLSISLTDFWDGSSNEAALPYRLQEDVAKVHDQAGLAKPLAADTAEKFFEPVVEVDDPSKTLPILYSTFVQMNQLGITGFELSLKSLEQSERYYGFCLVWSQLLAIFRKRSMYSVRNWPQLITPILVPLVILIVIAWFSKTSISFEYTDDSHNLWYQAFLVNERSSKFAHQQALTSVSPVVFWRKERLAVEESGGNDDMMLDLTGREVLEILARLHGFINFNEKGDIVLRVIGMEEQGDKQDRFYSGGLLAVTKMIILEKQTAGIDPKKCLLHRKEAEDPRATLKDGAEQRALDTCIEEQLSAQRPKLGYFSTLHVHESSTPAPEPRILDYKPEAAKVLAELPEDYDLRKDYKKYNDWRYNFSES